jgi:prepilin-type N-terminal cleavage/methylation domain-containing protein
MRPATRLASTAGFSLVEMLVALGLFTVVMSATMAGLADVMKGNELIMTISAMNGGLRAGVDVMIRDLLQAGSGLPSSHTVRIPSGAGSVRVRIPGPPGTNFQTAATDLVLPAVIPLAGAGPQINGINTDVVVVLMADNSFLDVGLTAVGNSTVTIAAGPNLGAGVDRIVRGQLMMISKGSFNTLLQVTDINPVTRVMTFADGDSLNLNQSGAADGNLPALNAQAPIDDPATVAVDEAAAASRISRMRMISYYLDNVADPLHPRLVRRVNNGSIPGDEITFNNTRGTAVAVDAFNLQFTYDINNGAGNPGNVEMTAADQAPGGACGATACGRTQIRKANLTLTTRAPNRVSGSATFLNNTLESQVSLRAMAFVDRYR